MSLKGWFSVAIKIVAGIAVLAGTFLLYRIWSNDFLLSGYSGPVSILRVSHAAVVVCAVFSAGLMFIALAPGRTLFRGLLLTFIAAISMAAATAVVVIRTDGNAENVFLAVLRTERFLLLNPDTNRLPDICAEVGPIVRYGIDGQVGTLYFGIGPLLLAEAGDGRRFSPCEGWLAPEWRAKRESSE